MLNFVLNYLVFPNQTLVLLTHRIIFFCHCRFFRMRSCELYTYCSGLYSINLLLFFLIFLLFLLFNYNLSIKSLNFSKELILNIGCLMISLYLFEVTNIFFLQNLEFVFISLDIMLDAVYLVLDSLCLNSLFIVVSFGHLSKISL